MAKLAVAGWLPIQCACVDEVKLYLNAINLGSRATCHYSVIRPHNAHIASLFSWCTVTAAIYLLVPQCLFSLTIAVEVAATASAWSLLRRPVVFIGLIR